jgi:ATP-dependent DNA helicase RecG
MIDENQLMQLLPGSGTATEQEERILAERRISFARSFDAQPCRQATVDDLDAARFLVGYRKKVIAPDVIAANCRTLEQQLAGLSFFDLTHQCPTHAGVLLFCDRPTRLPPMRSNRTKLFRMIVM